LLLLQPQEETAAAAAAEVPSTSSSGYQRRMTTEQWRQTYEKDGTVDLFLNDDFNAGAKLIVSSASRQLGTQQQTTCSIVTCSTKVPESGAGGLLHSQCSCLPSAQLAAPVNWFLATDARCWTAWLKQSNMHRAGA
jgi:hypothetical protein